jgi:hypothetical protein
MTSTNTPHQEPTMAADKELEWTEHLRDETSAIQAQQENAGTSHRPVAGPGLYGDHATNIYVREAVLAERERCAWKAALCGTEPALHELLGELTDRERELTRAVADAIVAAIRAEDASE